MACLSARCRLIGKILHSEWENQQYLNVACKTKVLSAMQASKQLDFTESVFCIHVCVSPEICFVGMDRWVDL